MYTFTYGREVKNATEKSKSHLPIGRYEDEEIRTQRTPLLLDESDGFHTVYIFTYGGEVKMPLTKIEILPFHREIWT